MKILHVNGRIVAAVPDADWFFFIDGANGTVVVEVDETGSYNKVICADVIRYLNRVDAYGLGKYYIENGELFVRDGWIEYVENPFGY